MTKKAKIEKFYIEKYPNICSAIRLIAGERRIDIYSVFREISKKCGDNIFSKKNSTKLLDELEPMFSDADKFDRGPGIEEIEKQLMYARTVGEKIKETDVIPEIFLEYSHHGKIDLFLSSGVDKQCDEIASALLEKIAPSEQRDSDIFGNVSFLSGDKKTQHKAMQLKLLDTIYRSKSKGSFNEIFADFQSRKPEHYLKISFKDLIGKAILIKYNFEKIRKSPMQNELEEHLILADKIFQFSESIYGGYPADITPDTISLFQEILNINHLECDKILTDGIVRIKEEAGRYSVYDVEREANSLTDISAIPLNEDLSSELGVRVLQLRGERAKLLTHVVISADSWQSSGSSNNRRELIDANKKTPERQYERKHRSQFFNLNTKIVDSQHAHQISTSFFDTACMDMKYKPKAGSIIHIFNGIDPLQIIKTNLDTESSWNIYTISNSDDLSLEMDEKREVAVVLERIVKVADKQGRLSLVKDEQGELIHPMALLAIIDKNNPKIPQITIKQAKAWDVPIIYMNAEDYPLIGGISRYNPSAAKPLAPLDKAPDRRGAIDR